MNYIRNQLNSLEVDGYIVPNNDEYCNEYLPDSAKRLEYITNFTGSAGTLLITKNELHFFTDGRYTTQSQQQLTDDCTIHNIADTKLADYIKNKTIAVDPWLHSCAQIQELKEICTIKFTDNLVDKIWGDKRPAPPASKAYIYDIKYAGKSATDKINELDFNTDYLFLNTADSINWLLNIRGSDIIYTPFCLCFLVVDNSKHCHLFINKNKLDTPTKNYLKQFCTLYNEDELLDFITQHKTDKWQLDKSTTPVAIADKLKNVMYADDPTQLPKSIKNSTEIKWIKQHHITDGKAVTKFINWVKQQAQTTELDAQNKLLEFRKESPDFIYPSFGTICGFNANGAIIHYQANANTNKNVTSNGLLLVDSGGQYMGCTTDITRTIAIGSPTKDMINDYTLVLKGHIAVATAKFKQGTTGAQIDKLARQYLLAEGKDYDHGTGHGVGAFLSVHEGPCGISKRSTKVALQAGMLLSNEPGYYKPGKYGIRIESLVLVIQNTSNPKWLEFETITKAPLEKDLIDYKMLSSDEIEWLDEYTKSTNLP